jgi:hypothetical protein
VAVAVPLIYLAGLAWMSSVRLSQVNLGYSPDGLFAVRLPRVDLLDRDRYDTVLAGRRAMFAELASVPGVLAVSAGSRLPFGSQTLAPLSLSGSRNDTQEPMLLEPVEPTYFATLGIPLLEGRTFDRTDDRKAAAVVIVNETIAARLRSHGRDLNGQVLLAGRPAQVIGVVGDTRDNVHPSLPPEPRAYVPTDQWTPSQYLFVRVAADDPVAEARVRSYLRRLWPEATPDLMPVAPLIEAAGADYRGRSTLLLLLAACAAALTVLGIYGAVSAVTRARTFEIAVRIICGANPVAIASAAVSSAMQWVAAGLMVGLLLGWAAARATSSLLFATDPSDWTIVGATSLALLLTAFVAALHPALQAARIDPAVTLREQ